MTIKYSFLHSELHENSEVSKNSQKFIREISDALGTTLMPSELFDYDCDLKLIYIESGGSEGLFLDNMSKLKGPYYLLTNGLNNSLAASLEILTYLKIHHLDGEILHGDVNYLAKRIQKLAAINVFKKAFSNLKLGVIGKPSDWLISSIPDDELLEERLGVKLTYIDISELIRNYQMAELSKYNEEVKLEFNTKALDDAKKMYIAIKELKDLYKLDGLTVRCFDLLDSCKTTSCLGFALLNSEGIVSSCEGDIMAMLSMEMVKLLFNQITFQANPAQIDLKKNEITFAHCTIPFKMLDDYKLDTHFESGIGVAVKGELKEDEVTIFRLSSDLKHYYVTEGKIVENLNLKNLCRTQILVKVKDDLKVLLTNPCGNHHIIFYGHHGEELKEVLNSLGFKSVA